MQNTYMKVGGAILIVLLVSVISFYAGRSQGGGKNFTSAAAGQFSGSSRMMGQGGMQNGRTQTFVSGEILSKDGSGITVKMQNGSTKIVLIASSTPISRSIQGSQNDLAVGDRVTVTGASGQDGSLVAQTVQIGDLGLRGGTAK